MKNFLLKSVIFLGIGSLIHFGWGTVDTGLLLLVAFIPAILVFALSDDQKYSDQKMQMH